MEWRCMFKLRVKSEGRVRGQSIRADTCFDVISRLGTSLRTALAAIGIATSFVSTKSTVDMYEIVLKRDEEKKERGGREALTIPICWEPDKSGKHQTLCN